MKKAFRLYNTQTRTLEEFTPLDPETVKIYSCGPTVYNYAHIGNLRAYVFVDVLKRALQWGGYQTQHVMNLTDVGHLTDNADAGEDKMEIAARRTGRDIWDLARYYSAVFFEHTGDLGILPADIICRATDHIPEQIELVRKIEAAGAAYRTEDGIYLDTSKVQGYEDFARLAVEGQQAGARVEMIAGKRNPTDFAIWKISKGPKRLMEWESPWGRGFPGWHLECSAMATRYLGEHFDIHTGGIDHIPVHHTNEIAQMKVATGCSKWVNYWLHNNFLVMEKEDGETDKMSKSAGGFITLATLRKWGLQPLSYRYFLLGTHYRKEARFSRRNVEQAETGLKRIWKQLEQRCAGLTLKGDQYFESDRLKPYQQAFEEALCDDLNTPRCLAALQGALKDEDLSPEELAGFVRDVDRVLGLRLLDGPIGLGGQIDSAKIDALVDKRRQARAQKDFATADMIRDICFALGIAIKDTPEGMVWSID